jgi:hypothetical protein
MDAAAPSGTAREEAVGSPPIEGGHRMSTTLRDPTARLLDLPPQALGPPSQKDASDDPRRSTLYTDRGRGEFRRRRIFEARRGPVD